MMAARTSTSGATNALRTSNERLLLERLLEEPRGLTRSDLARSLGLTVSAVSNLVKPSSTDDGSSSGSSSPSSRNRSLARILSNSDLGGDAHRAGPTPRVLALKPDLGYVMGIALRNREIQIACADLHGALDPGRDVRVRSWDDHASLHGALASAAKAVQDLAKERKLHPRQVSGIGLSIPAPLDVLAGADTAPPRVRLRMDLGHGDPPPWLNTEPVSALANHLAALPSGNDWGQVELAVDNDGNLGALAEVRQGAARGRRNILYVHIHELGIGAGLVFDGRIYRGAGGIAGEFGHVVLESEHKEQCPRCGRACIEDSVLRRLGFRGTEPQPSSLADIVRRAVEGHEFSAGQLKEAAAALGRALGPIVTLLNLDCVVIGGPFPAQSYGLIIPPIQGALDRLTIAPAARDCTVELGALGDDASLHGALWLALDQTRVDFLLGLAAGD